MDSYIRVVISSFIVGTSVFAFKSGRHFSAICLLLAGALSILFSILFAPNSSFSVSWETDSPLNIYFSYKPIGFLAANALPAIINFALVFAFISLLRHRDWPIHLARHVKAF